MGRYVRSPRKLLPSILLLVLASPAAGEYQLVKTVFSGGALETAGGPHVLRATVGEAGVVGSAVGGSYVLSEGFWSPIYFGNVVATPEPDPAIEWANRLLPTFPNPFRTEAAIEFTVAKSSAVELNVYDVTGRKVATLVDDIRLPGRHRVIWSGRNDSGRRVASGVYFTRLEVGSWTGTRKMLRVK